MERKAIELGGIVRNLPDNTVKDGTFHELINLRPKDGALRPVGTKDYRWDSAPMYPANVRWIHRISDNIKVYIGYHDTIDPVNLVYWLIIADQPISSRSTGIAATSDMSFASWNNILAISDHSTEITSILIFNETSNTYDTYKGIEQEPLLPDLPPVTFQRVKFGDRDDVKTTSVTADTVDDGMLSEWLKMNNEKADAGFLTGCLLLRCAWELVDGTIIKQSMPDKVYASELVTDGDRSVDPPTVTTIFTAYKIHFLLHCDPAWLADIQERYKGIIKSLVIYTTAPRSPELGKSVPMNVRPSTTTGRRPGTVGESSASRTYDVSTLSEYIPNIEEEVYYFLKEYSLKALTANTLTEIKLDSVLDIFTRQQLPINNFSHHSLYGKSLFVYNSRLFMSNIKNYLFRYININGLITPGENNVIGGAYNVHLEFDIAISNNKIVTVRSEPFACNYYNADGDYEFWIKYQELVAAPGSRRAEVRNDNSYWGYPDARAREARVIVSLVSFDDEVLYYLAGRYDLHSIAAQNFSYHEGVKIKFNLFMLDSSHYTTPAQAGKGYYYDHDRIQATELNNPFYYPPINSYRVKGRVLGLSTNAIALSSGQFGQFPIFVFTNEGIWTMSIGTGETLINSITPLSREVCNNPRSITPIDGGTAFVSGRGLFIISGNQVIEISDTAEGQITSRLTGLAAYNTLLSGPNLSGMSFVHCSVQFLEYLSGAALGFDYVNSELIVTNRASNPNYSWVYSLKSKMWFKISQSWDTFVNDYPILYAYEDGRVARRHEINVEDFRSVVDDLALVFGQTRPIKISGADFKKIHRANLGGNIQNDIAPALRFVVAVFGTTDNKTWFLLNNGRDFGTDDVMVLGRSQYSIRQIIIVFGGHIEADSYLNYLTFDFEERYGGKLR